MSYSIDLEENILYNITMKNLIEISSSKFVEESLEQRLPGVRTAYQRAGAIVSESFLISNPTAKSIRPPLLVYKNGQHLQEITALTNPHLMQARLQYDAVGNVIDASESILRQYTRMKNGRMALIGSIAEEFVHAQSTVNQGEDLRLGFIIVKGIQQDPFTIHQNSIYELDLPSETVIQADQFGTVLQDPREVLATENITHLVTTQLMPSLCPELGRRKEVCIFNDNFRVFVPINPDILLAGCEALYTGNPLVLRECFDQEVCNMFERENLHMGIIQGNREGFFAYYDTQHFYPPQQ